MFIAWYWIILIVLVVVGYICHMKRYRRAFRQDRDALLEARTKRFRQTSEGDSVMNEQK
ncbi:hypothetical protein HF719_001496 [Salmonella enterica]|nr:hypothetical protein [Salmonella enterica]EFA3315330.1 hypothetical protein [Salmonella enterica]